LFRTVQGMLRITLGRALPDTLPEASLRPLLRATGAVDLTGLRSSLDAAAQQVRGAFVRHLGEISE
jgi:hypothetical protein